MSDQNRPAEAMQKHSAAHAPPRALAAPPSTDASTPSHARALHVRAAARPGATREVTRLACAASLALFLGVGCGLWMFARQASASPSRLAGAPTPPAAHTTGGATVAPPQSVTGAASVDLDAAPSSHVGAAPSSSTEEAPKARLLGASRAAAASEELEEKRAAARVEDAETGGAEASSTKAAPRRGADAVSPTKASGGAGGANPCAVYTSAGSLSLRGGGAAALVLGGQVTVTTPDWADIAVFNEGRTRGAARAWTRYAVRSVSGKPGSYALRVTSPCGAQTTPVRVTP